MLFVMFIVIIDCSVPHTFDGVGDGNGGRGGVDIVDRFIVAPSMIVVTSVVVIVVAMVALVAVVIAIIIIIIVIISFVPFNN